jgi:hypothetical protein
MHVDFLGDEERAGGRCDAFGVEFALSVAL